MGSHSALNEKANLKTGYPNSLFIYTKCGKIRAELRFARKIHHIWSPFTSMQSTLILIINSYLRFTKLLNLSADMICKSGVHYLQRGKFFGVGPYLMEQNSGNKEVKTLAGDI